MNRSRLLALGATAAAPLSFASPADAQSRPAGLGPRITLPPSQSSHFSWERGHGFNHRLRGGFGGIIVVERPFGYAQDREVPPLDYARDERKKEEAPPPPAAVPLPEKSRGGDKARKPYVVGATYASLPSGCLKMIEQAASYYFCGGGEWYRQLGEGRSARYKAVARKL